MSNIRANIENIREKMAKAAQRAGRDADEIRLMAVSKTRSWDEILEVYDQGIRLFGENRVQEIKEKFIDMPEDLELHLIGHLQRNKARDAASMTSCVHSLDKWETLQALDTACGNINKKMTILLEVNTSGDAGKHGFIDSVCFFATLEKAHELKNLEIRGLMTMAPFTDDEKSVRAAFRKLRELRDEAAGRYSRFPLPVLSMGMSGDFETAIQEGSTLIRVGTLLFGTPRI